jgi:hypothetical protein
MLVPAVKTVAKDETAKVLDIFTMAFVIDPVMRWMMPESSAYLKNLGAAQDSLGGSAFEHGTAT